MKTFEQLYAAINPMPAMLSAKGTSRPEVQAQFEANASPCILFSWAKTSAAGDWDRKYEHFRGDDLEDTIAKALAFISAMPDAETAKLHDFMGQLGKLIDAGRDLGIEVNYLNPLTETMKRLSENILTHQPAGADHRRDAMLKAREVAS